MQKIKNKTWIKVLALIMEIVFVANPISVLAVTVPYDPFADENDGNVQITPNINGVTFQTSNSVSIEVRYDELETGFPYAEYTVPVSSYLDDELLLTTPASCADTTLDSNSVITSGTSPASGFCAAIAKCNGQTAIADITDCTLAGTCSAVNACAEAIANGYNKKIVDALQAATDAKIEDSGLDNTKANDALEACGGELACIDNVLASLQEDSSFATSGTDSSTEPLTAASLSDLINSSKNTTDSGPINSAANDQGGLLGKSPGPKVEVNFSFLGAGQPGAKMTANAIPSFFNNNSDPKKLYFTWYLKRKDCGLTSSKEPGNVGTCDMDEDGKITENDWKIAAAKIIVAKSFDRSEADYTKFPTNVDKKTAGYVAIPEIDKQKDNDKSVNIGWARDFLRDSDNKLFENNGDSGEVPNCYVQAPTSGRVYELRKVKSTFDNECPSGYHRACVSDQKAQCSVFNADPAYIEEFDACAVVSEKSNDSDVTCGIAGDTANEKDTMLKNFKGTVSCNDDTAIPICLKNDATDAALSSNMEFKDGFQNILGVIVGTKLGTTIGKNDTLNNKMCSAVASPDLNNAGFFLSNIEPLIAPADETCELVSDELINGTEDDEGNTIIAGNANLAPKCSFEKDVNLCKHLFPVMPKEIKKENGEQAIVGDGEFNLAEKQFWGADPTVASTNGTGTDEQNIVGLGVDNFEWMFTTGDQVGVVVEGEGAFQSDHANDASYQRMWAFSKGTCKALDAMEKGSTINPDDTEENTRGFYIDGSKGILTSDVDLNDCLEENLLEPNAGSESKLSVQLNASPANPINDPNGRGDILNIVSNAAKTQDPSGLMYTWSVQESRDGSASPIDTTNWVDITTKLREGDSFSGADIAGLGKKDLNINLNIADAVIRAGITNPDVSYKGTFYLRIKVKISGSTADGNQDATGMLIVRIKQQENEILAYPVIATDAGMLSVNRGTTTQSAELCSSPEEKTRCYVAKNQIVGIIIPQITNSSTTPFSWTINGNAIACSDTVSTECAGGNVLFFPILGNEGEAVDVVAKGLDKNKESIEVSQHFVIVAPQVQIESLDAGSVWPKLLGYYKDLDGNKYPDYSSKVFETNPGKTMTLRAAVISAWNQGQGFNWTVDGEVQGSSDGQTTNNQLSIPVTKSAGESYNVGLVLAMAHTPEQDKQANNLRKALLKNWGVSPDDSVEQDSSVDVQINVVGDLSAVGLNSKRVGVFASLSANLPEQFLFLLKITLTAFMIIFSMGLLFAFIPESLFEKEKREVIF